MSVLVMIPTYNERESLPRQIEGVRTHVPDADILVIDDASPDGTGEWAEELAALDSHVHVIHRAGKQGLGAAYRAGYAWGIEREYQTLVQMDADGSHQPAELPALLARTHDADLVLGSRWVPGGSVVNWPAHRKALSIGGNLYVRFMLGFKVKDATGGFRAYSAPLIKELLRQGSGTQGYCFQVDNTWRSWRAGATIVEVPIEFVERTHGDSKMSQAIVREALWKVTLWGLQRIVGRGPARNTL